MTLSYRTRPGAPDPLGATWDGRGANFALFSESATAVELCLVDSDGGETRIAVRSRSEFVWHIYVDGVGPGQLYGYRVHGPWEPERGLRFNPNVRLLDPYARALGSVEDWQKGVFSYDLFHEAKDLTPATTEQLGAPLGLVIDASFDWGDDARPNTPLRKSVIYETHAKGLTMRHPDIAPELRGTYLGVATDPILSHLKALGITAVELLPIHGYVDDQFLIERGLRNYWGYNSIAFFAPDVRYRSGSRAMDEVRQLKRMVKALHAAGIEVVLDVVYNHTAEGNHLGPTFSFRGIDNPTYYRLAPDSPRHYFDYTGTGNSLNVRHPQTLRLIMDSLRYWVEEMHVDGFRFDLASTLARGLYEVDRLSSFFTVIHQDPVLARVKLIAEPWDVGAGGYQVGNFPVKWSEWNGKYRDTMRAFWKGDGGRAAELGYRLTGSSDLYQQGDRNPASSINFITAHDGFTLADLVSYDHKHNELNQEENRDGSDDNTSWNCGVEGETDDPQVKELRARQVRNFLATLLLSQGIPMICGGDEIGRTQRGNNNAYCQDNEISWHDWSLDDEKRSLLAFARDVVRLRSEHPVIQRASFFRGREIRGLGVSDLSWFRHDGATMTDEDWSNPGTASLGMFMAGGDRELRDEGGEPQSDDDLVLLVNASDGDLPYTIPTFVERGRTFSWSLLLDTAQRDASELVESGGATTLKSRSLKLFSRRALGPGGLSAVYGAPVSTYRLQFRNGFGFADALAIVDYLDALGVGGVYSSPLLRAAKGSPHGYDVVAYDALETALGTAEEHAAFCDALAGRGLRHLLDIVPNHLGIGSGENEWWTDVLENGPSSVYADFFDVDWTPPASTHSGRVLLPVLGQQFGQEVDAGNIGIVREAGSFWVTYYDKRFPASPRSYAIVLQRTLSSGRLGDEDEHRLELESILSALVHLPAPTSTNARARRDRAREKEIVKRRLQRVCESSPAVSRAIDDCLRSIASSSEKLEQFLLEQNYRLAYWRVATEEINYRRFFDINELAAVRMENPGVFAAAHALPLELLAAGRITGLRLDHTDGLYDPEAYFARLQVAMRSALRRGGKDVGAPVYAVAEKILERGEELARTWAIAGTSGYDYLGAVNALWVDPSATEAMTRLHTDFTGAASDFATVVYDAKRDVMAGSFAGEIHVLAHALKGIAERSRRARDFTYATLLRAIREVIAAFDVYRTYVRPDGSRQKTDEGHIRSAIELVSRKNPLVDPSVFAFLGDVLCLVDDHEDAVAFTMRFQQLTGPIMAKGIEDTALYRYTRLVCLNEVGCDAGRFGADPSTFHAHNAATLARWPLSMTTTTTHDTKRHEDVRTRIAVLSEMPDEWGVAVARLHELVVRYCSVVSGERAPSKNDIYLFFQTVIGAYPYEGLTEDGALAAFTERIVEYMSKAVHESKLRTSWTTPNRTYDAAIEAFVRGALGSADFVRAVDALARSIAPYGAANSLAQLALRLASPGVPDVYQGCELWDLSLVDPDNRRPVDYAKRRAKMADLDRAGPPSPELARHLVESLEDGAIKLHVMRTALRTRRDHASLFLEGAYLPLETSYEHVVAFERRLQGERLVCVAPRLGRKLTGGRVPWALGGVWGDAPLRIGDAGAFTNVFTGERFEGGELKMAEVLRLFPVAWLMGTGAPK